MEYDPISPDAPVFSPTDKKRMTPKERMDIMLFASVRENPEDKGQIIRRFYNRFGEAVADGAGQVGQTVYALPMRRPEVVRSPADYELKPVSVYDQLTAQLLLIKARYSGQNIPDENDIIIAAENEIAYDKIIQTIDVCRATGFPNVSIAQIGGYRRV